MLHADIPLQGIRLPGGQFRTDRGIPQPGAKAVWIASGKLSGAVEKPSVIVNGSEIGNKRRIRAAKAVR